MIFVYLVRIFIIELKKEHEMKERVACIHCYIHYMLTCFQLIKLDVESVGPDGRMEHHS